MESPLFLSDLLTGHALPRDFTKTENSGFLVSIPGLAKSPGRFMEKRKRAPGWVGLGGARAGTVYRNAEPFLTRAPAGRGRSRQDRARLLPPQ